MKPTIDFLRHIAIFSTLTDPALRAIATHLTESRVAEGETLFFQDDPGDALYLIRSGRVAVVIAGSQGEEIVVDTLEAGDFLGEMSIFEHEPRSATCRAQEDSTVLRLNEDDFNALITEQPDVAIDVMHKMVGVMAERLEDSGALLSNMVQWGEEARRRAFTDELTGLYNRRYLDQSLGDQITRAAESGRPLCLVMMDLDYFTAINEAYGHETGDALVASVAPAIRSTFRDHDILARYGGDEFTFLLPDTTPQVAAGLCEDLNRRVASVDFLQDHDGPVRSVTCSQGIACFPLHTDQPAILREMADRALYTAKERGRNRWEIVDSTNENATRGRGNPMDQVSEAGPQKKDFSSIAAKNRVVDRIIRAFLTYDHYLIVGHKSPDADCFSSMVAVGLLLSKLEKDVTISTVPDLPEQFAYLLDIARYNSITVNGGGEHADALAQIEVVVFCDSPKPDLVHVAPEVEQVLQRPDLVRIEFDHHVQADSAYCGDRDYALVADTSSACELVGLLACKFNKKTAVLREYDVAEVFSRNLVLAILTGIVGDTQLGSYISTRKEERLYQLYSAMFERLLRDKTVKDGNFNTMHQVFSELQRVSDKEARCHRYLLQHRRMDHNVGICALPLAASDTAMRNFGPDTIVSVARGVADDLAEESGHVSLVVFYDALEVSDLIQFRCRRSRSYQELDLRVFLDTLEIENGGGHAGAIGFRVPRDQISDFDAEVSRLSQILNRMIAQNDQDNDGNSIT